MDSIYECLQLWTQRLDNQKLILQIVFLCKLYSILNNIFVTKSKVHNFPYCVAMENGELKLEKDRSFDKE